MGVADVGHHCSWMSEFVRAGFFCTPLKQRNSGWKTQAVLIVVEFLPSKFGQKNRKNGVSS